MKLTIANSKDIEAIATVCNIYSYKNINHLVRTYANSQVPKEEDLEVTVSKDLLPATYRYNPSLLAQKIQVNISDQFQSCSGSTSANGGNISIILRRESKKPFQRYHPNPSVKQMIKEWIDLNLPDDQSLELPLSIIPQFYSTHPEQLVYQIKQETQTPIKIKRFKTVWKITRKS